MTREQLEDTAYQLRLDGCTYAQVSVELADHYEGHLPEPTTGWARHLVRTAHARQRNQRPGQSPTGQSAAFTPQVSVKSAGSATTGRVTNPFGTYTFTGQDETPYRLPVFDGEPHINGDCVVVGDVHLPTTDYAFAASMVGTARKVGIQQLAIVGDLLNADAYSSYEHVITPPPFELEIGAAKRMIESWADWFTKIWMVLGNHELRLLRRNQGRLTADWLWHILSPARAVLTLSPYSQLVITSGGQTWRATHQRNYSKIKGRVGDTLAQKYQCNIVTLHQHHVAKMRDSYNRYTVIDGGGLFRDDMMAYVQLNDSTSTAMCKGYTMIVNGVGHLITPYESFTDLDVLLAGLTVRQALAA